MKWYSKVLSFSSFRRLQCLRRTWMFFLLILIEYSSFAKWNHVPCGTYCVFNFYVPMWFSDMAGDDRVVTCRDMNINTKALVSETLSQNFFYKNERKTHYNECNTLMHFRTCKASTRHTYFIFINGYFGGQC